VLMMAVGIVAFFHMTPQSGGAALHKSAQNRPLLR